MKDHYNKNSNSNRGMSSSMRYPPSSNRGYKEKESEPFRIFGSKNYSGKRNNVLGLKSSNVLNHQEAGSSAYPRRKTLNNEFSERSGSVFRSGVYNKGNDQQSGGLQLKNSTVFPQY